MSVQKVKSKCINNIDVPENENIYQINVLNSHIPEFSTNFHKILGIIQIIKRFIYLSHDTFTETTQ